MEKKKGANTVGWDISRYRGNMFYVCMCVSVGDEYVGDGGKPSFVFIL
jgi:hypothetical protein